MPLDFTTSMMPFVGLLLAAITVTGVALLAAALRDRGGH